MQNKKIYSIKESIEKIESYCSIQERCEWEVNRKLKEWGLDRKTIEEIINSLILENFIDNQRYAESFCRGKFKIKNWGKIKISTELRKRNISESFIKNGILQIEDTEYHSILLKLFEKKNISLKEKNQFVRKGKIAKYLEQKGFESNLIWEIINCS